MTDIIDMARDRDELVRQTLVDNAVSTKGDVYLAQGYCLNCGEDFENTPENAHRLYCNGTCANEHSKHGASHE